MIRASHIGLMTAVVLCSSWCAASGQTSQPTTQPTSQPAETSREQEPGKAPAYPAAKGFDEEGSDEAAIELAHQTMEAMGGWNAWQNTRYLGWTFFGSRDHVWDRKTGDVRIVYHRRDNKPRLLVLMNINSGIGRAWDGDVEITDEDELAKTLKNAKGAWINDSYWLLMPYKLKDSGVTIRSLGAQRNAAGDACDVISLTFKDVGNTPQNKYHVYIDSKSHLVVQWDFFRNARDETPLISTPWLEWEERGEIMLSGERGDIRGEPANLTNIAVFDEMDRRIFDDPEATIDDA